MTMVTTMSVTLTVSITTASSSTTSSPVPPIVSKRCRSKSLCIQISLLLSSHTVINTALSIHDIVGDGIEKVIFGVCTWRFIIVLLGFVTAVIVIIIIGF
eukprot:821290_1